MQNGLSKKLIQRPAIALDPEVLNLANATHKYPGLVRTDKDNGIEV